jgi:hypothetical protein
VIILGNDRLDKRLTIPWGAIGALSGRLAKNQTARKLRKHRDFEKTPIILKIGLAPRFGHGINAAAT